VNTGFEAGTIALDGSASSDGGTIVEWAWDCDGVFDVVDTVPTGSTCFFADDGSFTIQLQVTSEGCTCGSSLSGRPAVGLLLLLPMLRRRRNGGGALRRA
jgi:hypothetical protein